MKEAAGEANMTVVTIVLITAVVAIATPIIVSTVRGMGKKSCCQGAGGYYKNNQCLHATTGKAITGYWDASKNECANIDNN